MNEKIEKKVDTFIESVNNLFGVIESWIALTNLTGIRQEIEISEEASGRYKIEKLVLEDENKKKIVEFQPIGTFIIGGNGRIDMLGTIDKAIIVNLEPTHPSIKTKMSVGENEETQITSFYEGVNQQGWYWIEDRKRGKANLFTKDLFIELLREVSDYELN